MTPDAFQTSVVAGSDGGETAAILAAGMAVATPLELEEDVTYAFRTLDGDVKVIDGPESLLAPVRIRGKARFYDADSFGTYFLKHQQGTESEVYGDPYGPAIIGVLNGNGPTPDADVDPALGFGDHTVSLIFRETLAWQRWIKRNGVLGSQSEFAEHIEDSLPDIIDPAAAEMLELAQSFQAHTKVAFESAKDLGSGQRQLVYREEIAATAGQKGSITIPKEFEIAVPPYEGTARYKIKARLRYRLEEGRLRIGYVLDRPEDLLRVAFDDVLVQVQNTTGRTALLGLPPQ